MAFHLYPDPVAGVQSPLHVAGAGGASGFIAVDLTALGGSTLGKTFYLRVCQLVSPLGLDNGGQNTLTVLGGSAVVASTKAQLRFTTSSGSTKFSLDIETSPSGSSTAASGTIQNDTTSYPTVAPVYLIRIDFNATAEVTKLELNLQNFDQTPTATPIDHAYTWVAAPNDDTGANGARHPWINATPAPFNLNTTFVNQESRISFHLVNYGPGVLSYLTTPPAIPAPFALDPSTVFSNVLAPGASQTVVVKFTPTTVGSIARALVFSGSDGAALTTDPHNGTVNVSVAAGNLEVVFLLDASGSMAFTPDPRVVDPNETPNPTALNDLNFGPADTVADRWAHLREAAGQCFHLLTQHGAGSGSVGFAVFPDIVAAKFPADENGVLPPGAVLPAGSPSAGKLFQSGGFAGATMIAIPATDAPFNDGTHTLKPLSAPRKYGGATPITSGLALALGTDLAHAAQLGFTVAQPGFFSADPGGFNTRWLLLLTDGKHNSGPAPFDKTTNALFDPGWAFATRRVYIAGVAYGSGSGTSPFEVDLAEIKGLASLIGDGVRSGMLTSDTSVDPNPDDPTYSTDESNRVGQVRKNFATALTSALDLTSAWDPYGVVSAAEPEARHCLPITPFDGKVSFLVDWDTRDPERLIVQLMTPLGELLEEGAEPPGVHIARGARHRVITIERGYLLHREDPATPRYGCWTLVVRLRPGARADRPKAREAYMYTVIMETGLRLAARLGRSHYAAGDPIQILATFSAHGAPVRNAWVNVVRASPARSRDNWLAAARVSAAQYQRAAEAQAANPDVNSVGIKAIAAGELKLSFPAGAVAERTRMEEVEPGVYRATFDRTSVPGAYDFHVEAVTELADEDRTLVRREARIQTHVGVRPTASATSIDVRYRRIDLAGGPGIRAEVRVSPRDSFGNVVFIDPNIDPSVRLTAVGAEFTDPLVDNHDGSYTRILEYPIGVSPAIGLVVAGDPVVHGRHLPSFGREAWIDHLFEYREGGEAAPGANQHGNPGVVLGDFTLRQPHAFCSLGANGSITVGFEGRAVLARGDDDLTVFVEPDEEARPYRVEALAADEDERDWVTLGTSPGITRSFSLGHAGVRAAAAVRITDTSGRVVDGAGGPSATPGVSLLGVCAHTLGRGDAGEPHGLIWEWRRLVERVLGRGER